MLGQKFRHHALPRLRWRFWVCPLASHQLHSTIQRHCAAVGAVAPGRSQIRLGKFSPDNKEAPVTVEEFSAIMSGILAQHSDLASVIRRSSGARVCVAVSGGPDSMALAALVHLWAAQQSNKVAVTILSVDHCLRPESSAEIAFVQEELHARFQSVCLSKRVDWGGLPPKASKVVTSARQHRYDTLSDLAKRADSKCVVD